MFRVLTALGLVLVTVTGAWGLGWITLGRRLGSLHPCLRFAIASSFGLLLVSDLLLLLVLLEIVTEATLGALVAFLSVAALVGLIQKRQALFAFLVQLSLSGRRTGWLLGAATAYGLWILAVATLPVTSVDELIYHLEIPKKLAQTGGSFHFEDNIYAYFPQLGEMLFLLGWALNGALAARLFHGAFGLLLALALFGFSRGFLPRRESLLAVSVLLSVPSAMVLASLAYVDLIFTCYAFLALVALLEYVKEPSLAWACLMGLLAGGAWCTKYTGMQFLLLLILVVLLDHLWMRRKDVPWHLAVTAGISLMLVMPYFLRNWFQTGWPMFPFDPGVLELKPGINWDPQRGGLFLTWLSSFGTAPEGFLTGRVLAPLRVFLSARFDEPAAFDGVLGPAFLLTPFLMFRLHPPRPVRTLLLFCLAFVCFWTFTSQQVRFLLPAVPVLVFLLAYGVSRQAKVWITGAVVLLTLWNLGLGVRQILLQDPEDYWLGRQTGREYQSERIIGFDLYQQANRQVGPEELVYLVNMRNLASLLECRWKADFVFEQYRVGQQLERASGSGDLWRFFRGEGATHLMIDEDVTFSSYALAPRERSLLREFLDKHCLLLARDARRPGQSLWLIQDADS